MSQDKIHTMPDFFHESDRIEALRHPLLPITHLDYSFKKPSMDGFLETFEGLIDSSKLFEYEDYDYIHNGSVVNNLQQCRNLYSNTEGDWTFLRRERIKTGQNLNFTVYNKIVGWFPEIAQTCPDIVSACDGLIEKHNIDVWKILVFKMDQDLIWHQDVDGFYGFRMFLGHDDWLLKFREIRPEFKDQLRDMTWQGRWQELNDSVPKTCYPKEFRYTSKDLGQAFLIDSMNYVHYFENTKPMWGVFVKGVI